MRNVSDIFPDVLRIEAVGQCNFRCIHCPTGIQPNKRQLLSEDKFATIIDQFREGNFVPRVVVLYHGGEPLLNKYLALYIRLLKGMGVSKTVINTNSSLLSAARSEELIRAGLDEIKISFDGQSAEENNLIRKNGDFYKNAKNVKAFCELRKKMGRKELAVIVSNVIICEKDTLVALNKNRQDSFSEIPRYLTDYFKDEGDDIEFRSFPAMIWPGYEKFGKLGSLFFPVEKLRYCGPLFETYTIMANGDVVPCCYDLKGETVFGNVFAEDMFDIWQGREYTAFRDNFRRQKYSQFCLKCNVVAPRFLCKDDTA